MAKNKAKDAAKNAQKNAAATSKKVEDQKKSGATLEAFKSHIKKTFDSGLAKSILDEIREKQVSTVEGAIMVVQQLTNLTIANGLKQHFKI